MDLFDDLFDGSVKVAKKKKKAVMPRPLALDEADDDLLAELPPPAIALPRKRQIDSSSQDYTEPHTKQARTEGRRDVAPTSTKAKKDPVTIMLDDKDPDNAEEIMEDEELRKILQEYDEPATTAATRPLAASSSLSALHQINESARSMKRVLKAASKSVRFEAPATSVNLVDDDIPSNQIKIVAKLDGKDAPRVTVMVDLGWTIDQTKTVLANVLNVDVKNAELIFLNSIVMDSSQTLRYYELDQGDEIGVRVGARSTAVATASDLDEEINARLKEREEKEAEQERALEEEENQKIRLKLKVNKQELKVSLKKDDPFEKVIQFIRRELNVPEDHKVVLEFDGDAVDGDSTPADFDCEDDDQLDAYVKEPQIGSTTRSGRRL